VKQFRILDFGFWIKIPEHNRISPLAICTFLFALCVSAEAQLPKKTPQIGLLVLGSFEAFTPLHKALTDGLREFGYIDRRNIAVESRFADGKAERLPDLAAELVRLKLDLILTLTNSETSVLKQATTTIPIVMVHTTDPIDAGFITSLARPGGNITGLSMSASPELQAKRLELLKEIVPGLSRVAILRQANVPGRLRFAALEHAARSSAPVCGHPRPRRLRERLCHDASKSSRSFPHFGRTCDLDASGKDREAGCEESIIRVSLASRICRGGTDHDIRAQP
jgi:hypothetical protein